MSGLDVCAFVGNTLGMFTSRMAVVDSSAGFGQSTLGKVTIANSWFVGNRSQRHWCLLRLPSSPPTVGRIVFRRTAVADNDGLSGVETGGTPFVECAQGWLASSDALFTLFYGGTELLIDNSDVVGTSLDQLIAFGPKSSYTARSCGRRPCTWRTRPSTGIATASRRRSWCRPWVCAMSTPWLSLRGRHVHPIRRWFVTCTP